MRDTDAPRRSAVLRRLVNPRLALLLVLLAAVGCDLEKEAFCGREFGIITRPGTTGPTSPVAEGIPGPLGDLAYLFCMIFGASPVAESRPSTEAVTASFLPLSQQTATHRPTALSCSSDRCAALNFSPTGVNICSATTCDFVALPFGTGALQFSPDGRTLMAAGGSNFRILELAGPAAAGAEAAAGSGTEALPSVRTLVIPGSIIPLFAPPAIAFDPLTSRAHVCTSSGIVVLDPPYTSVAFTVPLAAPPSNCAGVAVTPDGSRIAATRNNNTVRFFAGPLTAGSTPETLAVPIIGSGPNLVGVAFARDGSKLVAAANSAPDLYLVEPPYGSASTVTKVTIPGVGAANGWTDVAFKPDNGGAVVTGAATPAAAADTGMAVGAFPFGSGDFSRVTVPGGRGAGVARFLEEAPCPAPAPAVAPAVEAGARARGGTAAMAAARKAARGSTEAVGPLVAAVLPLSRSVRVGCPATAFVTVINSGTETATGVSIAPATPVPAAFVYQTTNASNALVGTPNTPATIPPGQAQSFVIALTPTAPFPPTQVAFTIAGTNAGSAVVLPSINTLLLSASPARTGDPVALAGTTPRNDGIVDIPGDNGTGIFVVATVNVGINSVITVSGDTGPTPAAAAGEAILPVTIRVCQTNTATGACLADPAPSVTVPIAANATPSFAFFVQGSGTVAFDPAVNRAFVRLRDALGNERGSTSVALRTLAIP